MTYTIYSSQVEEVSKRLDRIARKADRYGVPFGYTIGEEHPQKVAVKEIGPDCRTAETVRTYIVEAVDIEVECEGFVKANGWTVLAKIEHGDKGNIVTTFGMAEAKPEWYTAPARCDHCGTNRFRAVTFICQNDGGEFRQVGRSCLKDYTGINPSVALMWAEVRDILSEDMEMDWTSISDRKVARMYEVEEIIAHACDSIKAKGYIKSDQTNCTREQVAERIHKHEEPSKEATEKAKRIIEWLQKLGDQIIEDEAELNRLYNLAYDTTECCHPVKDEDAKREYIRKRDSISYLTGIERDCIPLAKSGFAKGQHFGRLVYMPLAYDRYIERMEREARRNADAEAARNSSNYVGEIGKRMEFHIAEMKLISSWETQYGTTYLYKFLDTDGNVLVWFASQTFGEWTKDGRWITYESVRKVKATVKDHNERDGVKQTIITRCKRLA